LLDTDYFFHIIYRANIAKYQSALVRDPSYRILHTFIPDWYLLMSVFSPELLMIIFKYNRYLDYAKPDAAVY